MKRHIGLTIFLFLIFLTACQKTVTKTEYVCSDGSTTSSPQDCPQIEYPVDESYGFKEGTHIVSSPEGNSCGPLSGMPIGYLPVGEHTECTFECVNGKLHYDDCRFRSVY